MSGQSIFDPLPPLPVHEMQSIGFDLGVVAVNLTGCRRSFSVSVAPSLSIGTSAEFYNLINKFQCFGCEEHGNVLEFVTLLIAHFPRFGRSHP